MHAMSQHRLGDVIGITARQKLIFDSPLPEPHRNEISMLSSFKTLPQLMTRSHKEQATEKLKIDCYTGSPPRIFTRTDWLRTISNPSITNSTGIQQDVMELQFSRPKSGDTVTPTSSCSQENSKSKTYKFKIGKSTSE